MRNTVGGGDGHLLPALGPAERTLYAMNNRMNVSHNVSLNKFNNKRNSTNI